MFYFAFAPIAVFAQTGSGNIITSPSGEFIGIEPGVTTPEENAERQRLADELNAVKPNEEVEKPYIPENVGSCGIKDWLTQPIGCGVLYLLYGLGWLVSWLFALSAGFMSYAAEANFSNTLTQSAFVRVGWGISRDVANMFFIFFVLWMALATIFQFESYSTKRLLPKLIVVALLVNFSLPIGVFVINTANAIGKVFYDLAQKDTNGQQISFRKQLMNMTAIRANEISLDLQQTVAKETLEADCKHSSLVGAFGKNFLYAIGLGQMSSCAQLERARWTGQYGDGGLGMAALVAALWRPIILLVATFVFFAGGIFLIVRYLYLIVLLIFGPLAFLFMILPATQEYWNKWWNKLIQWSFFVPAFFFMIMLSVRLNRELFPEAIRDIAAAQSSAGALFVQYIMGLGLFIASLMVANSMGIAMSGTVVGWGRSMARWAGKYAKGKGIQYAKIGAGGLAGGIQSNALLQKTLSAIPLLGGSIARGLGATRAMGEVAEKQRQRQKFGFAEKLSDEARGNYIASERAGVARDLLEKMDNEDRARTINALSTQGALGLRAKLRSVGAEALIDNATNNPEVYARGTGEAGDLDSPEYLKKVADIAHKKFKPGQISPAFFRTAAGREYLKTADKNDIRKIMETSRQSAEALGGALAEIARIIHEETGAIQRTAQLTGQGELPGVTDEAVRNNYLTRDAQQYLNTAPGIFEGRMITRIRKPLTKSEREADDSAEPASLKQFEKMMRRMFEENKPPNP